MKQMDKKMLRIGEGKVAKGIGTATGGIEEPAW